MASYCPGMHPDEPTFQLEIDDDDDERFARIMTVWLEWLRRQASEDGHHD